MSAEVRQANPLIRARDPQRDDAADLFALFDAAFESYRALTARAAALGVYSLVYTRIVLWANDLPGSEMRLKLWASSRPDVSLVEYTEDLDGWRERIITAAVCGRIDDVIALRCERTKLEPVAVDAEWSPAQHAEVRS